MQTRLRQLEPLTCLPLLEAPSACCCSFLLQSVLHKAKYTSFVREQRKARLGKSAEDSEVGRLDRPLASRLLPPPSLPSLHAEPTVLLCHSMLCIVRWCVQEKHSTEWDDPVNLGMNPKASLDEPELAVQPASEVSLATASQSPALAPAGSCSVGGRWFMLLLLFLLLSLVHVSAVFAAVDGSCCCCFCCCRWFRQGLWLQHPLDKEGKLALGYGKPHDHDPNKMVKQKYKSQPSTQVRSVKGGGGMLWRLSSPTPTLPCTQP